MKLVFNAILIGAEDKEKWLCDLKHSKIKIKRKLYSNIELIKKYEYFELDSRWMFWFDREGEENVCYELIFEEDIDNYDDCMEERVKIHNKIFSICKRVINFINCYFGTSITINYGNVYLDDKFQGEICDSILLVYNPSILEDYFKIDESNDEIVRIIGNIEDVIEKSNEIESIIEHYNINLSIYNAKIAFLNLMICLESLLVSTNNEVAYQISRGVSVLLSKNKEEGNRLFIQMKKLYEMRSKLVHTGEWKVEKYYEKYDNDPFEDLKKVFILSFRKFIRLNLGKNDFIKIINENGYGDLKDI